MLCNMESNHLRALTKIRIRQEFLIRNFLSLEQRKPQPDFQPKLGPKLGFLPFSQVWFTSFP